MRTVFYIATAAALALAFRFEVAPSAAAKDGDGKLQISVDDLGKTADLIGRLGKPLGSWVTIKGTWALPKNVAKDYSLRFTATHVNGMKLPSPVEFNIGQVRAVDRHGKDVLPDFKEQRKLDGRTWTLKGYETGRLDIQTPPEYFKAIGRERQAVQKPYWTRPFISEFNGVLQLE